MRSLLYILIFTTLYGQDEFSFKNSTIGGYGELHINSVKDGNKATETTADFHRFVLFYGHTFSDNWSFKAEVELEHNYVKNGQGELELEQAFVNYRHSDQFNFKIGVLLAPVGIINETHEPPTFNGLERPMFDNIIIPTTWFDNGLSVYGIFNESLYYNVTILGGLNGDKINTDGLRGSRTKGYKSSIKGNYNNPTLILKLDYSFNESFDLGISFTKNDAKVSDPLINYHSVPVNNYELRSQLMVQNLSAKFQYGVNDFGKIDYDQQIGSLIELSYLLFLDESVFTPFIRYENINAFANHKDSTVEKKNHKQYLTIGLSYKPLPEIVFKADYINEVNKLTNISKSTIGLGVGYMF